MLSDFKFEINSEKYEYIQIAFSESMYFKYA